MPAAPADGDGDGDGLGVHDRYGDEPYADQHDGGYGRHYRAGYGDDGRPAGIGRAVRTAASGVVWRYRAAPLRQRVCLDIGAAGLVLVLIVGAALALRQEDGPRQAAADSRPPRATTTVATTVPTTAAPTTTTPTTTTTTAPTTTTTVATTTTVTPPTTVATAPPAVPPPTTPPTTVPAPTSEPVVYDDCREALRHGAELPLEPGEPGYGDHLDRNGDGVACDPGDWRWRD